MENHKRTLAKTISWRLIAYTVSTITLYLFSHDAPKSLLIVGTADVIKIFIYYFHERAWNRISFGRAKPFDYQI